VEALSSSPTTTQKKKSQHLRQRIYKSENKQVERRENLNECGDMEANGNVPLEDSRLL
jgi:hypothetical protein